MQQEQEKKQKRNNKGLHAVGRRKTATCTINMVEGDGESLVNGKKLEVYFTMPTEKASIFKPFAVTNTIGKYHFAARVSGGGISGQADAVKLAIARCLSSLSEDLHATLAANSLLTRDPRAKERKKIFFVRARKKPQYSKR